MGELSLKQVRELVDAVSTAGRTIARFLEEGFSPAMQGVIRALTDCIEFINRHDEFYASEKYEEFRPLPPIWIFGEDGVGKRTLVQRLHEGCERRSRSSVLDLDCRKVAPDRVTPILFGETLHGSQSGNPAGEGMFHQAHERILVIHEPPFPAADVWDTIAEWLQTGDIPLGGPYQEMETVDAVLVITAVEIISTQFSTSPLVKDLCSRGLRFIHIPPLRERREDVVPHLEHFLRVSGKQYRGSEFYLSVNFEDSALLALVNFSWPDNLLGLRRVVEFMVLSDILKDPDGRVTGDQVRMALESSFGPPGVSIVNRVKDLIRPHGRPRGTPRYPGKEAMENFEQQIIQQDWTQLEAAAALGVADSTLCRWRQKADLPKLPLGRRPKNRLPIR